MNVEFQPTSSLSLRAAIGAAYSMLALPRSSWIILFSLTSGFALVSNCLRASNHETVAWWQWAGSLLFLPLLLFLCVIAAFLRYRFASRVAIDENGILFGSGGRILSFWQPIECSVRQTERAPDVYLLSIFCRTRSSRRHICIYEAPTDDPTMIGLFIDAFNEKYKR